MAIDNEAPVGEILESIKKVIDRDGELSPMRGGRRKIMRSDEGANQSNGTLADKSEDNVLDLSEMELSMDDYDDDESAPSESLLSDEARGAMRENLAALAMLAKPGAKPQIVRSGETSLEGMTRDLLRPMLAEWLDKNLPAMVEEMVQAEIVRIAGKRG